MKYIIFEDRTGMEYPILFGEHMAHKDVVLNGFSHPLPLTKPVAAGFVDLSIDSLYAPSGIEATCYGESRGLLLKSRGEKDAKIIEKTIKFKGV